MLPSLSTPTQKPGAAQVRSCQVCRPESKTTGDDQLCPSKVTARPARSTTAQNVADAQEMKTGRASVEMVVGADQVVPSNVRASPSRSTAAQKVSVGHDTDASKAVGLTR